MPILLDAFFAVGDCQRHPAVLFPLHPKTEFNGRCAMTDLPETNLTMLTLVKPEGQLEVRLVSGRRSEEHTSELQSLMRISYAVFCLKKKTKIRHHNH